MTTAQPLDRAEQIDAMREGIRTLVSMGLVRWTNKGCSIDNWPTDEPLPMEVASTLPIVIVDAEVEEALLVQLGVSFDAPTPDERIVKLPPNSTLSCPMHEYELVPDTCRSCKFLAGER